ncbi:MAG: alanine--tRNA ligase [Balneolaceae bacterium]
MTLKRSDQIRQEFFDFFREKDHIITDSAPVVPKEDPTLLFTNAGMNQFKPIFLGEQPGFESEGKIWSRAADTQRCIRVSGKHNDLEEVGHDTYHHTLFEMLGNWSFGDYFKKEAISWAWELLVKRWGLDPDRLYVTVFEGDETDGLPVDEEAAGFWKSETGIRDNHILKFGKKDNFWEMGETGPCGPCSEVHVDLRPDEERKREDGSLLVNRDDPRVMEIWNLVFIQFNRQGDGSLIKLPAQHVDTGMGFERICAVLQGKSSNYDTDIFTPILSKISSMAGVDYGSDEESDIAMRVIADHIRAVSFAIADGASPSNEGRGYVIRRILRRAIRYGWDRLNFKEPFFHRLVPVLADQFSEIFPELNAQAGYVTNVVRAEEQSFLRTLGQGIELFHEMTRNGGDLSGEDAFKLHDTYGFPIDLTQLMAREKEIEVDSATFDQLMKEQKERARAAGKFTAAAGSERSWQIITESDNFEFIGYDTLTADVTIRSTAREEKQNLVLLSRTPFYAESGGQVADTGVLKQGGETIRVLDVQKGADGFIHVVDRLPDSLKGTWQAEVDQARREEIQKHHTATHLMHAALRRVLGDHVVQKGSLVRDDRLRFDFSHFEAVNREQLDEVESIVNEKIQNNIQKVEEREVPIDEARKRGAMMLFGEKYGDRVRVITFDEDYSVELCGGTHAGSTGEIGYFRFLGESSAAAGIRRVEAVTGREADRMLRKEKRLLDEVRRELSSQQDLLADIRSLMQEKKELEQNLRRLEKQQASGELDRLLNEAEQAGEVRLISSEVAGADMDTLKQMGYDGLEKVKGTPSAIVLGSRDPEKEKVYLMAAFSPELIESGLKAGDLVGHLGKVVGGGGGGQSNVATAGGRFPDKLGEALQEAGRWITQNMSS